MQLNQKKNWLTITGGALFCATLWLAAPAPSAALTTTTGNDHAGKNCERVDSPGSSTFGKCENVCGSRPVTRDATNNRWVCNARQRPSDTVRPPKSGGVYNTPANPTATPVRPGGKTGKVQPN